MKPVDSAIYRIEIFLNAGKMHKMVKKNTDIKDIELATDKNVKILNIFNQGYTSN